MKSIALRGALLLVFAAALVQVASAQKLADVNGNWTTTSRLPTGNVSEKWVLHQDGAKVTGTATTDHGDLPVTGEIIDGVFLRVDIKDGEAVRKVRATFSKDSLDGSIVIGEHEYIWSAAKTK
jgi:hypothetical protein